MPYDWTSATPYRGVTSLADGEHVLVASYLQTRGVLSVVMLVCQSTSSGKEETKIKYDKIICCSLHCEQQANGLTHLYEFTPHDPWCAWARHSKMMVQFPQPAEVGHAVSIWMMKWPANLRTKWFSETHTPPKHRRASCARWKFRCKKMIEDELSGGFHVGRRTTQSTWAANMMNANECQWTSPAQVDHYLRGTHQLQIAKQHSTVRDKSSSFRLALARSNLQLPKCWYYSSLYLVPSPPFHIVLSSPGQLHISPSTGTTG
jgi:hypothetical protein